MSDKIKIGKFGQSLAVQFLIKRNYQILTQNYFCKQGEIDIVAKQDEQIIFTEVKTRLSRNYGLPEESVNAQKIEKLDLAAMHYLESQKVETDNYRFDLIAVEIDKDNKKAQIRQHKGIE
jgi:putative endonuclease